MNRPVVHFEIGCDDLSETVEFYRNVLNWTIAAKDNSASIDTGMENGIQGHITKLGHDPRKYITIYIQTETIAHDLQVIESKGGKILVGPIDLPDGSSFAWFEDIAGNTVGLITPFDN